MDSSVISVSWPHLTVFATEACTGGSGGQRVLGPGATARGLSAVKIDSPVSYSTEPPSTWKRCERTESAM
jgi:hypothetical protein